MKKRLLAILLSLMMVLSLLPVGVFAADAKGIGTGAELAELFTKANAGVAGSGDVTVKIDKDYNLTGYDWTSLTVDGYQGAGIVTVEGNSHTITGLNAPLFAGGFAGTSGIVIKDLTLDNVSIKDDSTSDQGIGAFINNVDSMPKIELDNCHLTDSSIVSNGGARVGGLIGWTSGYNKKDDGPVDTYITVKNCSVENTEITAKGSVGGIIGHAGCNPATFHTFTDNTVTGCTLNSTDNGGWRVGVVVGTANVGEVALNNTTESGNTVTQTGKTAPAGQSNLYGRFVPGTTGKLVIDGVAVFNSDIVAAIGNTGYKTLADAVTAAKNGDTVTLLKDAEMTETIQITDGKKITLALDGHDVVIKTTGKFFLVRNGELTVTGAGMIKEETPYFAPIIIKGGAEKSENYSVVNVEKGVILEGWAGVMIDQTIKTTNNYGMVLNVNGATLKGMRDTDNAEGQGVYVNGVVADAKVTLNNATLIADGYGMYLAGNADTTITGGSVSGTTTGIEIRAGKLTLDNCDVTGGSGEVTKNANGNGSTVNNAALAISQHTTKKDIDVTINGGTYTGTAAVYQTDVQGTGSENVKVNVNNGKFNGTVVGETTDKLSISGGYFTSDPTAYLAAGHHVWAFNKDGYAYMVKDTAPTSPEQKITVNDKTDATVSDKITDDSTAINNVIKNADVDGVAEAVAPAKKAEIVAKSKANPDDNNKVEIEVAVKVEATAADLANGKLTFEAKPVATVKVDGTVKGTEVPVDNTMLNGNPITVKLPLPTVDGKLFTPKQIKHTSADGSVEYFLDHSENGARVFKIENGCAVFTITKFSTFELSGTQTYVAPVYTPITKKDVKFDDVDVNAYYAPAVKWAVENKITAGKTDKLFAPDDTCTRGEMITFLWNAAGKPAAKNTANPFTDVNAGAFYYDAVLWAVSNGITSGTSDTTFSPDNTVSRAQVVAFLYNYANKPAAANSTFSDVAADAYYAPAVGWAAAQKITSGTGNNTFSPENDCTRAQIVTFLYNDLAK